MMSTVTAHDALVREAQENHGTRYGQEDVCWSCMVEWPCLAARLADALKVADERVRALEAGLAKYGQHVPGCPMFASFGYEGALCECGLAALAGEP
jgi:hypothetical protein